MRFDQIGYWSEVKLDIIRDYATAYSKILSAQRNPRLDHVYIDGFSGPGVHIARRTGEFVPGSPLNALNVQPPFREYFLVDLDGDKVEHLRDLVGTRTDVHIQHGDCNDVLLQSVFPSVRYEDYRRALCVLDPYGLHLDWRVIQRAGQMRSIDLFLNFPIMDMNRNVLWRKPEGVGDEARARMTAFWGDDSWETAAYRPSSQLGLFGQSNEKAENDQVAAAFRQRLLDLAGFRHVPEPMPMRNTRGATVYYLFFASQKLVAEEIWNHIFDKYT